MHGCGRTSLHSSESRLSCACTSLLSRARDLTFKLPRCTWTQRPRRQLEAGGDCTLHLRTVLSTEQRGLEPARAVKLLSAD